MAHREYNAGNTRVALTLFTQLAMMGYESAQVNAAFILSKMYCPANMDFKTESVNRIIKDQIADGLIPDELVKEESTYMPGKKHLILASGYHAAFLMPDDWLHSDTSTPVDGNAELGSVLHTGPGGSFENIPRTDAVHCEKR